MSDSLIISLDVETGGLDPWCNSLLSLGAVALYGGKVLQDENFYSLVKAPVYHVTAGAMKVNGLSLTELDENGVSISEVGKNFRAFVERMQAAVATEGAKPPRPTILGHNVKFDLGFLEQNLGKEFFKPFDYHTLDTSVIAAFLRDIGLDNPAGLSLEKLCSYYDIPHGKHNALGDALSTAKLYLEMVKKVEGLLGREYAKK